MRADTCLWTSKGSTTTVRPRVSSPDFKIAVWEGTQALNLLLKLVFTMKRKCQKLNTKIFFFRYRPYKIVFQEKGQAMLLWAENFKDFAISSTVFSWGRIDFIMHLVR